MEGGELVASEGSSIWLPIICNLRFQKSSQKMGWSHFRAKDSPSLEK